MSNKTIGLAINPQNTLQAFLIETLFKKGGASKNDLFQFVLEHLPDQIYLKDPQGNFIMCNTPVALNAGCAAPEEMIGKSDFDFYPAEDADRFFEDEQEIMRSANALVNHEEHYTDKKTNEIKWNLTTKVPIKSDTDKLIGLLGINRDITQMKNALLEREHTMNDLLQRNKDLEHVTYIVSHDLRVPVANILGLLQVAAHTSPINSEDLGNLDKGDLKAVFNGITESAKKLDQIIHDLNYILETKSPVNSPG